MKPVRAVGRPSPAFVGALATMLVACATPILSVEDVVRFENGDTRFVAFTQKKMGWFLSGVPDVDVHFMVDGQEVASGTTDERGFTKVVAKVQQQADGFEATANFAGRSFHSEGELVSWRSDRIIVACDIDSTISETSLEALFFHDIDDTSQPIEGSVEALREIAEHFQIMYLTARPRFTLAKTRHWLEEHGYPREPVVTSLTVGDALSQTVYKTRTIKSLRKHYKNLLIGIGNTDIDSESYGAHGMLTLLVQPKEEPGREDAVIRFQNWSQIASFFRVNRALLQDPERVRAAAEGEGKLLIPMAKQAEYGGS